MKLIQLYSREFLEDIWVNPDHVVKVYQDPENKNNTIVETVKRDITTIGDLDKIVRLLNQEGRDNG